MKRLSHERPGLPRPSALLAFALALACLAVACTRESVRGESPHDAPTQEHVREADMGSTSTATFSTAGAMAVPPARSASAHEQLRFLGAPADAELGAFLRTERLRAKGEGRLLVLYAGAPWCPPCRRFHSAAHGGALDASLGRVTLVELDADKDAERLSGLGYVFKNIPYFAVPSETGRPTSQQLAVVDVTPAAQDRIVEALRLWSSGSSRP